MTGNSSSTLRPVIIGAGPAGLAAAQAFVEAGIRPVVLEETNFAGGQGTRRLNPAIEELGSTIFGRKAYEHALERQKQEDAVLAQCDYRPNTLAWGIYDGAISTLSDGRHDEIAYEQLLVAIGATDRIMAVEGWQLSGVYSLGGAQVALKTHASSIGRKLVFAGSSPLLYLAAAQYARLGFTDITILDTTPAGKKYRAAIAMARYSLKTLLEGMGLIRELRAFGVRIRQGARLIRFEGDQRVRSVAYLEKGAKRQSIECDAVAFGFGLRPEIQLAELAGARLGFNNEFRQWFPLIDDDGRAGANLWLAGDSAAIGGADAAAASGRLAALTMLGQHGKPIDHREVARLRARVKRLRNFQKAMAKAFLWPGEEARHISDETYVCRCERVTAGEIRQAIGSVVAHTDVNRIKAITRCGMGRCQGRFCSQTLQEIAISLSGKEPDAAGWLRAQAPFRPIPVGENAGFLNQGERDGA